MLTAAYVIGGRKVLSSRFNQLLKRMKDRNELEKMRKQAVAFGTEERKWLRENATRSYNNIVKMFEDSQGNHFIRKYQTENILPKAKGTFPIRYVPSGHRRLRTGILGKDNWKNRITQSKLRQKIKQRG